MAHGPDQPDGDELWDIDPFLLPQEEEQSWLLSQLGALVKSHGYEHLALAPLIEPTPTYFPDPWAGGELSLLKLLMRLFVYADLEEVTPELVVHPDEDVGGNVAPAGIGAPIWLVRRQGNTLHFAARASALRDPEKVVPAAARAAAEGWRVWHGIHQKDTVLEQRLVDVTAIFLGFGVLTTNASLKHGATRSDTLRLTRTKSQLGVLSPKSISFLLGAQVAVRELDAKSRKKLVRGLQPNQAGFLKETLRMFDASPEDLAAKLNLPPRARWGQPPALTDLTAPFVSGVFAQAKEAVPDEPPPPEDKGVVDCNVGQPVFRVERSKALRLAKMLALPVGMLGMLSARMNLSGVDIEMWKIGLAAAALGLLGLVVGRFLPDNRCSEPKCGTTLSADDETCPRCGGTISGVIHHPKERLAAEEALTAAAGADAAAPQTAD